MKITLTSILKSIENSRNADGKYVFHDKQLYEEMIHDKSNYYMGNNGMFYLMRNVLDEYIVRDTKRYLEKTTKEVKQ